MKRMIVTMETMNQLRSVLARSAVGGKCWSLEHSANRCEWQWVPLCRSRRWCRHYGWASPAAALPRRRSVGVNCRGCEMPLVACPLASARTFFWEGWNVTGSLAPMPAPASSRTLQHAPILFSSYCFAPAPAYTRTHNSELIISDTELPNDHDVQLKHHRSWFDVHMRVALQRVPLASLHTPTGSTNRDTKRNPKKPVQWWLLQLVIVCAITRLPFWNLGTPYTLNWGFASDRKSD